MGVKKKGCVQNIQVIQHVTPCRLVISSRCSKLAWCLNFQDLSSLKTAFVSSFTAYTMKIGARNSSETYVILKSTRRHTASIPI